MYHPFLIGKKVYLRGLEEKDIEGNYFQWFNDAEVCKYNNHHRLPNNRSRMLSYINEVCTSKSNLVLAIISKSEDLHIGNIALQNIDWINRNAEFAIIIGEKKYWGKGYAKEAGQLIINHGFAELGLVRIYCGTCEDNKAMERLALSLGMKEEGRSRKALFKNNKYRDTINFGILKGDSYD